MNAYMKLMEDNGTIFTEEELITEIITKNIPSAWKMQFKLQALHKAEHLEEITTKLQKIESEIKIQDNQGSELSPKDPEHPKNGEGKRKNLCKLPCHKGHTWEQCYNNKNGNNFKGKALTQRVFMLMEN